MRTKIRNALLTAALLGIGNTVGAAELYYGVVGMGVFVDETGAQTATGLDADLSYDDGYGIGGLLGFRYENPWRFELGLTYREYDFDQVEFRNIRIKSLD